MLLFLIPGHLIISYNYYLREERLDGGQIELDDVTDLQQSNTIISIVDDLLDPYLESPGDTLRNFTQYRQYCLFRGEEGGEQVPLRGYCLVEPR